MILAARNPDTEVCVLAMSLLCPGGLLLRSLRILCRQPMNGSVVDSVNAWMQAALHSTHWRKEHLYTLTIAKWCASRRRCAKTEEREQSTQRGRFGSRPVIRATRPGERVRPSDLSLNALVLADLCSHFAHFAVCIHIAGLDLIPPTISRLMHTPAHVPNLEQMFDLRDVAATSRRRSSLKAYSSSLAYAARAFVRHIG